jgi:hypothetical protein
MEDNFQTEFIGKWQHQIIKKCLNSWITNLQR